MRLDKFINDVIARNTLIRLWKPERPENPNSSKILLTKNTLMEWEVLKIPQLCLCEAVHVTDILCEKDSEAVNIVILTELQPDDVLNLIKKAKRR